MKEWRKNNLMVRYQNTKYLNTYKYYYTTISYRMQGKIFEVEKLFEKGCFLSNSHFPKLFNYGKRGVLGEREPFFSKRVSLP